MAPGKALSPNYCRNSSASSANYWYAAITSRAMPNLAAKLFPASRYDRFDAEHVRVLSLYDFSAFDTTMAMAHTELCWLTSQHRAAEKSALNILSQPGAQVYGFYEVGCDYTSPTPVNARRYGCVGAFAQAPAIAPQCIGGLTTKECF